MFSTDLTENYQKTNLEYNEMENPTDFVLQQSNELKCGDVFLNVDGEFSFTCYFCDENLLEFNEFSKHIKAIHLEDDTKKDATQNAPPELFCEDDIEVITELPPIPKDYQEDSEEEYVEVDVNKTEDIQPPFFCEKCGQRFQKQSLLTKHKFNPKLCETSNIPGKRFKCRYCDNAFKFFYTRNQHERIHTGEKPYECDVCKKTFRLKNKLNFHYLTHTGERPYKCTECPAAFARPENYNVHVMRIHRNERPFKCELCEKRFVKKFELKIHMRRHMGEKQYTCQECGKSFVNGSELTVHWNSKHVLFNHFTCEVCGKKFNSRKTLNRHMDGHTIKKTFVCLICDKTFARLQDLNSHIKSHSVRQYNSEICDKAYSTSSDLTSHMNTQQKEWNIDEDVDCDDLIEYSLESTDT